MLTAIGAWWGRDSAVVGGRLGEPCFPALGCAPSAATERSLDPDVESSDGAGRGAGKQGRRWFRWEMPPVT